MELSRRKVPLYGQAKVFALLEGLDSLPEDAEVYVVLEGSTLVHVTRARNDVMLCFVVPGHNLAEVVSVQAYLCSETTPLTWVGGASLEYVQDDAQDLAEHLVIHGHCLTSTDHMELRSLFSLGQESSRRSMDHCAALAMANLDIPQNWNVLGCHSGDGEKPLNNNSIAKSATMNITEVYNIMVNPYNQGNVSGNGSMGFLRNSTLNRAINIFSIIILFIAMISLGCTMEISRIKAHLYKPKGVFIALLAQFGIMPLSSFCLAKMLQLSPIKALTVLICGCCPGGSLSNIFSLAIKGDMNLSITMTTCSSIAALGLMPLLLFLLCKGFPSVANAVPYPGILTGLTLTLIPCTIGITVNHYKPHYSPFITKAGLVILIISSIIVLTLSGIAIKDEIWMVFTADIVTTAALMPLTGFMMGYAMSIICRLSPQCCRTISMETGCQNVQLCSTVLKVAFPPQVIGPMFVFPFIYMIMQCAEALLLILCFRCYQKFKAQDKAALDSGSNLSISRRSVFASTTEKMTSF